MNEPFDEIYEPPPEELLPGEEPDYLRAVSPAGHCFGTLKFNARSKTFSIAGEPCVCQLAKKVIPGAQGRGRGRVRFPATKRNAGELNWLMQRYPLTIAQPEKWGELLEQARRHAKLLRELWTQPLPVQPGPDVFAGELMSFQKEGVGYLLRAERALLADEMGLGKTVQALAALAELNSYPALIVVPPHLLRNWQREIGRFLKENDAPPETHVIRGLKPYDLPEAKIYLIHYLLLRGWKKELPKLNFRVVIFDEMQELRHSGTEKYSAASLLSDSAPRVVGLSGTPIYNRGGEIWNVVNALEFHALCDYESFTREWCTGYGNDIVAHPEELGDYLRREGLLLRRTKEQVLSELPPKRRVVQEIDSDSSEFARLIEGVPELIRQLDASTDASERALLADQIDRRLRQATGISKAPYVAAFVRALLDAGERVLLFAHHHAVMDIYKREFKGYRPAFITGRENEKRKDESAEAFMAGRTDLCCISLRAASGLNLQRASLVVFGELDWSPAVHAQAEDRAHRIGQKDSILCYYLVSSDGMDAQMQDALGLKVSQFVALMGDRAQTEEEARAAQAAAGAHIQGVIDRLRARYAAPDIKQADGSPL